MPANEKKLAATQIPKGQRLTSLFKTSLNLLTGVELSDQFFCSFK